MQVNQVCYAKVLVPEGLLLRVDSVDSASLR